MTTQRHDFDAAAGDALVTVEEVAPPARFSLRTQPAQRAAVSAALGLDLPETVGKRAEGRGREALCLGPDEWVVTAPEAGAGAVAADLAAVRAEAPHALTDISDREVTYAVAGPEAPTLLSIGCPRDLDRIAPGEGRRTVFDGVTVVLWRDGPDAFRMDVWRSFAPHVRALLETGRAEIALGL